MISFININLNVVILTLLSLCALFHFRCFRNTRTQTQSNDEVYHFIAVVSYGESVDVLNALIDSLKETDAKGKRILFLGLENRTDKPEIMRLNEEKIKFIKEMYCDDFDDIVISRHTFDATSETRGACSNILSVQKLAMCYAENNAIDAKNAIWYKFDANNRVLDDLQKEVEDEWLQLSPDQRLGFNMIPLLYAASGTDDGKFTPEKERKVLDLVCCNGKISLTSLEYLLFGWSVNVLSLEGLKRAQLTNPKMTSEDHLTPIKTVIANENTKIIYLNSTVLKVFPNFENWISAWWDKQKRWNIGSIAVTLYLLKWMCGFGSDHIPIRNKSGFFVVGIITFANYIRFALFWNDLSLVLFAIFGIPTGLNRWMTITGISLGAMHFLNAWIQFLYFYNHPKTPKLTCRTIFVYFVASHFGPILDMLWFELTYIYGFIFGQDNWKSFASDGIVVDHKQNITLEERV